MLSHSLQLHAPVIHVTIRNVKAVKKFCCAFQCADTLKDFQLGKKSSRGNVGPKVFLGINEQMISVTFFFFFSPKREMWKLNTSK